MGVMVAMAVVFTWLLLKMLIRWWIFVFIRYIERSAVKMEWDGNARFINKFHKPKNLI
jgi:hypothetical protein